MDILKKIALNKKMEVEELKINLPLEKIKDALPDKPPFCLSDTLRHKDRVNIIAEVKKGSPSRGIISEDFDPVKLAGQYKKGGAAALSVLTESKFFFGDYSYIDRCSKATSLPVLCKDFMLEPYQVYHAKYINADAILLIIKLLPKEMISMLLELAEDLGLDVLVEVHSEQELKIALETDASIIGVNNRNLQTFEVTLQNAVDLAPLIPSDKIKVAESGIFSFNDIQILQMAGYNNFLIGEALVKADNPTALIRSLCGHE